MEPLTIRADSVLEADFLPEPVRVLAVSEQGEYLRVDMVGLKSQRYYQRMFSADELSRLRVRPAFSWDLQGDGRHCFLGVEGHRIRLAYLFDPLLALNVSQVDPLPHQIEAVYHHILKRPSIRFLLADDPGAGKTIMTGLVLKELKYRGLAQRILLVVPGHLRDQWRREMKERFDESFTIIDRERLRSEWGRNLWEQENQVIVSMDFAKQDDVMAGLADTEWDFVVVDEAHKMAAYQYGNKTSKTERYRLGELLSRISRSLLFLTATPHRGDPENFRLLLNLLQPDMFADEKLLRASINQGDNPLFLRRLKEDLRDFQGRPLFPPRRVSTRAYALSEDEKRLYNGVTTYVEQQYNRALATDKRNVAFALLILQRRMASSVRAVRRSLERRKKRLEELLRMGQWLAQAETLDEEALEDAPEEERLRQEEQLVERLTAAETQEELKEEIRTLEELIRLAAQAEKQEVETKLKELRDVLEDECLHQTGEKLLIFTESRDTLDYLVDKLRSWGYSVVALHGGQSLEERIRTEHEFRHNAQIMVSTEAGGEGINLQFCSIMVNYDIPWNPNRLEQRMGRIHRYGQQKEVHIYNLVAADTREGSVLRALFEKLERMASAMGSDRVFDVIGEVTTKSLRDLIVDAIARRRSLDDILAEIEAVPDEEAIRRAQEATLEALATRHIDLQGVLGEHQRARENRLSPEYVEAFFEKACELLGVPLERRNDGLWRLRSVPLELRQVNHEFKRRYGEVQRDYTRFTFVKEQARRTGAEFIGLGHPLLETILEQVQKRAQEALKRGACFADPEGKLDGWLWFVVGEVRDGDDKVVGSQMFTLYQSASDGTLCPIQSSVLWDLIPLPAQPEVALPPQANREVDSFVTNWLESYRQELSQQRQYEAEIKRKYGLRSLEQRIVECESKIMEYEERRFKGVPIPEAEFQRVRRQLEDYRQRRTQLEQQILRETSLTLTPPEIITVVRVVPQPIQIEEQPMVSDAEIEAIGMQVAMEYERRRGAEPVDVSQENCGYDIRSTSPDGTVRYIEVKARATTGAIVLTRNEWINAQRFGDDYWLYVVEHAATQPQLYLIQNPVENLNPEPIAETVRFLVQAQQWKKVASREG